MDNSVVVTCWRERTAPVVVESRRHAVLDKRYLGLSLLRVTFISSSIFQQSPQQH